MSPKGRVLLVGAGPGAADLLTIRALRAIQSADIVLHDDLVGADILDLIANAVPRIAIGKRGHRPSTPQDFVNRLMLRRAQRGECVVRLKGGDPSLFGRAAEERDFLEAHGVDVEVVAGVTTASAAAAQFGFSLTERAVARRVLFATGRTAQGAQLDWRAAADAQTTLCLYMGCGDIATIAAQLIEAGRAPETPALAAINVERAGSTLINSTLARLPSELERIETHAPVYITIGAACRLAMRTRALVSAVADAAPPAPPFEPGRTPGAPGEPGEPVSAAFIIPSRPTPHY